MCVFRGAQRPYHRQSRLVRKREGLRESQITWPALVLLQLFRSTQISTSAFPAVKWGCSQSLRAGKVCDWVRHQRRHWGWGRGVGTALLPYLGGSRNLMCIFEGRRAGVER